MQKTDYSKIADTYNKRYDENYLVNIEREIKAIITANNYKFILEAGCGTGRWISALVGIDKNIFGLDYSFDMMKIPKQNELNINFVNADAVQIPFKNDLFDLIFCVNAIHHFQDKEKYIKECGRTMLSKGTIAVFSVDPHIDKDWYVYDYFDSVYENDLKRFPSIKNLMQILEAENFKEIETSVIEKVNHIKTGKDILNDPFLAKHHSSQLANLSDEEYQKGINKIKNRIEKNPETAFITSVIFYLVSAKKK